VRTRGVDVGDVEIVIRGDLPPDVAGYAHRKIVGLLERLGDRVLHARIRLTGHPNPSTVRPVRARANLDVNGRMVYAQVAAVTGNEAIDLLVQRLRHRLIRQKQHWEARRGRFPSTDPHEWRHGGRSVVRGPS
jgi:hypothetical protein